MATDSIRKEPEYEDFVIDINPLDLPLVNRPECCIYRVPKQLRNVNEKAYTPKLVSIGPFHHNHPGLMDMEMYKVIYLMDFMKRTGKSQEDLLKIIIDNEVKIRHCYSEHYCWLNSKVFVQMILLDAIFIIELFLRVMQLREKWKEEKEDYILRNPWLLVGIANDLILLENQVPFFILEKLYMFAFNDLKEDDATFLKLSCNFFAPYDNDKDSIIDKEVKHFTDLLRYFLCSVPGLEMKPHKGGRLDNRICATKLEDAGLKFKGTGKRRLLDIRFDMNPFLRIFPCFNLSWFLDCLPCLKNRFLEHMQPILEVPLFVIDINTEVIFRNLIALEQCLYPFQTYICNYARLLVYLIDSEKDVDLLVEKKIIVNYIGSNQAVVELINRLSQVCVQIVEPQFCYFDICEEINGYSHKPWNRIMGNIKSRFFPDFWRGAATIFAIFVTVYQLWGLVN